MSSSACGVQAWYKGSHFPALVYKHGYFWVAELHGLRVRHTDHDRAEATAHQLKRYEKIADALWVGLTVRGGATVCIETGGEPKWGYVASVAACEETFDDRASYRDVFLFVVRNATCSGGDYIGAWKSPVSGVTYLDVSCVFSHQGGAEAFGRENGQLAIFDVENCESIFL